MTQTDAAGKAASVLLVWKPPASAAEALRKKTLAENNDKSIRQQEKHRLGIKHKRPFKPLYKPEALRPSTDATADLRQRFAKSAGGIEGRIRLTGDRRFSGRGCRMGKEGDETVGATEGKTAPSALDAGGKGPLGPPA